MSNIVPFNPSAAPSYAVAPSAINKAIAGSGGGGKRISIKGGAFRLFVDGKEVTAIEDRYLDVVIVNAAPAVSRTYYEGTYSEENPSAPACWSNDGKAPDAAVESPMSANCANCPMNAKGSGQGDTRACRFSQRLAVVLANDMEGDVLQLQVPATSLFGKEEGNNRPLQAYARWLSAQNINLTALVTRMKFDIKATAPKLFFDPVRWLTESEFETCKAQGETEDAKRAVTLTVAQVDKVQPVALPGKPPAGAVEQTAKRGPGRPRKTEAAPVQEEQQEEVQQAEEPAVRRPAATVASTAARPDVKSVIDAWGTDDE